MVPFVIKLFFLDKCNNAKSDFLAAENHLAAWTERNWEHQVELQERLVAAAPPCDVVASQQIAKWAYQQTEKANGQVWVTEKVLRHLGTEWVRCFCSLIGTSKLPPSQPRILERLLNDGRLANAVLAPEQDVEPVGEFRGADWGVGGLGVPHFSPSACRLPRHHEPRPRPSILELLSFRSGRTS